MSAQERDPRSAGERVRVFDGHNDLVLRLWQGQKPRDLDLSTAAEAGFSGGFFALFQPWGAAVEFPSDAPYAQPLAMELPFADALGVAQEQVAVLEQLDVKIARQRADLRGDEIVAVMHLEGAEAISADCSNLNEWYARGLRSVGLVWSRPNVFGTGVPFRFPSSGDIGEGLTDAGRQLVKECARLGLVVDISHLNEAGFWDVMRAVDTPVVATHANAHALCAASRNLTDEQLRAIAASGGVIGITFSVDFVRQDGRPDQNTPLGAIIDHVEHIADLVGVEHVAFGSDFEGALLPVGLSGVEGFPELVSLMHQRGMSNEDIAKVARENWIRVLGDAWRE